MKLFEKIVNDDFIISNDEIYTINSHNKRRNLDKTITDKTRFTR